MSFRYPQSLHERRDVIGKQFGRVRPLGLVTLTLTPEVQRDTCEVLGVVGDLKSVTSGQVRDQDERLSCSLLVVVHGYIAHLDFRHLVVSFLLLRFTDVTLRVTLSGL